jgi:hypothetical protein
MNSNNKIEARNFHWNEISSINMNTASLQATNKKMI